MIKREGGSLYVLLKEGFSWTKYFSSKQMQNYVDNKVQ